MSNMDDTNGVASDFQAMRQFELAETFFNHSVSCLVILDRHYNFIRVNQAYAQACRRDINAFVGHNHFALYPSDAKAIFDEVVRTKRPYVTFTRAFEFSDQPERGVTYWDWTLVPVLDGQGEVEYLVFSLVEVTDRKRAEEALRIAALVYQHSAEAMMVTDADNRILAINDAFTGLTGYGAADVIGMDPSMLHSECQTPSFYEEMWKALASGGHWQGELIDRRKDGALIAVRLTINSVYDDDGKVERRVALFSDITEKQRTDLLIWEQANIDTLTGLPNRHMFLQRLHQHIAQASQSNGALTLLLIDLDQFKEINDTLGHDTGDLLLIEVARRIRACTPAATPLARLGGDEFSVILSMPQDLRAAAAIAQATIAAVAAPIQIGAETLFVSASVGIALYPEHGTQTDTLLRHADQAMYAAKSAGRNRYCYFTGAMQDAAQAKMSLMNDLRGALGANQFDVHYQPIVDLATGETHKAEALLRWHHPVRGMVSPAEFIPLAEASGMILEIGEWVFKQAVAQVRRLRGMGYNTFQISVNVSPVQFQNDHQLSDTWFRHLAELALPASSMVIEITEGLLLDLSTRVSDKLLAFAEGGIQVALDDFGTGYSSLAYLKKFDIDYLKIDRVFVHNLESDPDDRALCEAIIAMAHKLGLKVIAEGVETAAHRELLAAAGCDHAQGLFSRPIPAADLEALLDRSCGRRQAPIAPP
jgi:diguanylate cyclase (GGDEF)-like protein/PAS domain S-box-containing protein